MARRVLTALIVSAVALAVYAQVRTVSRVGIVVKPQVYRGPCPATLTFEATIFVTRHPATVVYQWERSDGAKGARQRVTIDSAGRGVVDTWTLGGGLQHLRVWEQLHVVAPTNIRSPRAVARVNCR